MSKAILCVDDEKIIIVSLIEQLRERFGNQYLYEMAMSGEEALEIIDEMVEFGVSVILIISDWLMTGMKGDELLIRIHQKYPNTVKVMLTGQADTKAIDNARENADLKAYIAKPWDKNILMDKIGSLLEGIDNE